MTDDSKMHEETLLDQTLVRVDVDSYQLYLDLLDLPPSGEGFERLMRAPKPWPHDAAGTHRSGRYPQP
jgi:uncharacterized protein (DUF1778 family)